MITNTSAVKFRLRLSNYLDHGLNYILICLGDCFFFFFFFLRDRVSLYSPGCPGTHFVDQAGLELRNPPASASRVLGLKVCTTTPGSTYCFLKVHFRQQIAWSEVMLRACLILKNELGYQ
jgi:hypothetical protein